MNCPHCGEDVYLAADTKDESNLGWWVISGEALMVALYEVQRGTDPGVVYAEMFANSEGQHIEGGG